MPILERKIEINAPVTRIWEVLSDIEHFPKWNFSITELKELGPDKFSIKSNVGNYTTTITEHIENERISAKVDHPQFMRYGYVLKEKGDVTELSHWMEYEAITHEKIQARSHEIILKEIKNYTEYLEDGGDPDEYDRKQILVKP